MPRVNLASLWAEQMAPRPGVRFISRGAGRPPKFSAETLQLARSMRVSGAKLKEITAATGIAAPFKLVHDVKMRPRQPSQPNLRIVAEYRRGRTMEDIGADLGIGRERVRQIIKQIEGRSLAAESWAERYRQRRLTARPTLFDKRRSLVMSVNRWLKEIGSFYCSYGHHAACLEDSYMVARTNVCRDCNTERCRVRCHKLNPEWRERTPEQRANIKRGMAVAKARRLATPVPFPEEPQAPK